MTYRNGESQLWATTCAAFAAAGMIACNNGPEFPNCSNDSDCHEAEFCVNGQCQQCRPGGNDCPPGQECNGGRCQPIDGWCNSAADCPEGMDCVNNRCVPAETGDISSPGGCNLQTVYFAYDAHDLDATARGALESNAQCIQTRDIPHVTITGHCDPRGTEEYNLALGERRAQAVQGHLGRLGVDRGRMTSRSMGEEMARGSDESSWGRDRRVEIEER